MVEAPPPIIGPTPFKARYVEQIAETDTRVTVRYYPFSMHHIGGYRHGPGVEAVPPTRTLHMANEFDARFCRKPDAVPYQLQAHDALWRVFTADLQQGADVAQKEGGGKTMCPAFVPEDGDDMCDCCILCCTGRWECTRRAAAVKASAKRVVEQHSAEFAAAGVQLSTFDKSGCYSCSGLPCCTDYQASVTWCCGFAHFIVIGVQLDSAAYAAAFAPPPAAANGAGHVPPVVSGEPLLGGSSMERS